MGDRVLDYEAFPTPGHASHHVSFLAPDGSCLVGDAAGVRIPPARCRPRSRRRPTSTSRRGRRRWTPSRSAGRPCCCSRISASPTIPSGTWPTCARRCEPGPSAPARAPRRSSCGRPRRSCARRPIRRPPPSSSRRGPSGSPTRASAATGTSEAKRQPRDRLRCPLMRRPAILGFVCHARADARLPRRRVGRAADHGRRRLRQHHAGHGASARRPGRDALRRGAGGRRSGSSTAGRARSSSTSPTSTTAASRACSALRSTRSTSRTTSSTSTTRTTTATRASRGTRPTRPTPR